MKLLLLCGVLTFSALVQAQITKDSLLNKMSKEICITLEGKMKDTTYLKNASEAELGELMQPVIMDNLSDIQEVYKSDATEDAFRKMGYDLALRLLPKCPAFATMSVHLAKEKKKEKEEKIVYAAPKISDDDIPPPPPLMGSYTNEETVTLVSVNPGDITTITVKNKKGKLEKLYWFEYFENADEFKSNSKKYLGKKVTISTSNKDVYNAATKNYKAIKIIEGIDLAN